MTPPIIFSLFSSSKDKIYPAENYSIPDLLFKEIDKKYRHMPTSKKFEATLRKMQDLDDEQWNFTNSRIWLSNNKEKSYCIYKKFHKNNKFVVSGIDNFFWDYRIISLSPEFQFLVVLSARRIEYD